MLLGAFVLSLVVGIHTFMRYISIADMPASSWIKPPGKRLAVSVNGCSTMVGWNICRMCASLTPAWSITSTLSFPWRTPWSFASGLCLVDNCCYVFCFSTLHWIEYTYKPYVRIKSICSIPSRKYQIGWHCNFLGPRVALLPLFLISCSYFSQVAGIWNDRMPDFLKVSAASMNTPGSPSTWICIIKSNHLDYFPYWYKILIKNPMKIFEKS